MRRHDQHSGLKKAGQSHLKKTCIFDILFLQFAAVAKLADAHDSKSCGEILVGSSPTSGTIFTMRGIGAAGSAFDWQSKGQGFESPMLHHKS